MKKFFLNSCFPVISQVQRDKAKRGNQWKSVIKIPKDLVEIGSDRCIWFHHIFANRHKTSVKHSKNDRGEKNKKDSFILYI